MRGGDAQREYLASGATAPQGRDRMAKGRKKGKKKKKKALSLSAFVLQPTPDTLREDTAKWLGNFAKALRKVSVK